MSAVSSPKPPSQPRSGPSFLVRLILAFLKVMIFLVLVAVLAGGAYLGISYLYREAIQPARENTLRIQALETNQSAHQRDLETRLAQLNDRLTALESRSAAQAESLDEANTAVKELQKGLERQSTMLKELDDLQIALESLKKEAGASREELAQLQKTLSVESPPFDRLQHEIAVLKAMQLLNRSRLYLFQKQYGLAEMDVRAARLLLLELAKDSTPTEKETIGRWVHSLELALNDLEKSGILFSDGLEATWEMMLKDIPNQAEAPVVNTPAPVTLIPTRPAVQGTLTPWPTLTPTP